MITQGQRHEAGAGAGAGNYCPLLLPLPAVPACCLALLPEPANRAAREIDPDALHLRVQIQRVPAHLAPVARLLITTKGRRCIEHVEGIDPDNTRLDLFRETMRARDVPGPDSSGQPIDRVVCLLEQIVFVFESDD